MLIDALEGHCREAGIEQGTAAHDDAAWLVMTLFSSGISTPEDLRSALSNTLAAAKRYG